MRFIKFPLSAIRRWVSTYQYVSTCVSIISPTCCAWRIYKGWARWRYVLFGWTPCGDPADEGRCFRGYLENVREDPPCHNSGISFRSWCWLHRLASVGNCRQRHSAFTTPNYCDRNVRRDASHLKSRLSTLKSEKYSRSNQFIVYETTMYCGNSFK